jgi:hypothetical protein
MPFLALLTFLRGPLGTALLVALFLLASGGAVWGWKRSIRHKALAEYNQAQVVEAQKEADKARADLKAISEAAKAIQADLVAKNNANERRLKEIESALEQNKAKDRPSSILLQDTLQKMSQP